MNRENEMVLPSRDEVVEPEEPTYDDERQAQIDDDHAKSIESIITDDILKDAIADLEILSDQLSPKKQSK